MLGRVWGGDVGGDNNKNGFMKRFYKNPKHFTFDDNDGMSKGRSSHRQWACPLHLRRGRLGSVTSACSVRATVTHSGCYSYQ